MCFSQGLATLCSPIRATWSLILLLFHLGSHTSREVEQARLGEALRSSLLGC